MTEFSEWVRDRRMALALTRGELGTRVGVSAEHIRMLEVGKRVPSQRLRTRLDILLNDNGDTPIPDPKTTPQSRGRSKGNKQEDPAVMVKLSEMPINTLIVVSDLEVDQVGYIWWIKDSDLFWTPLYAANMEAQDAAKISNDEVDWTITKFEIKSLPVGYSLPEEPTEFIEKRQELAEFLLKMATGYSWDEAEGVDGLHYNYMKDADDILRQQSHLLGLETREKMGLI